jgi:hypothetical protein
MTIALKNADCFLQRPHDAIDLRRPSIGDENQLHRAATAVASRR